MKFSIITVAFNSASTITETLRSVSAQTYPEVQHIVIDGASTDGTQLLARTLIRGGGRVISEPDDGLYDAMNKGIALADGDIIGILNSDDVYAHPDVLHKIAEQFAKYDVQTVLSDVGFFRDYSKIEITRRYNSGHFHPRRLGWGWMPAHPGMFMLKQVYDEIGTYRTDYKIAADFELIARAFGKNAITYKHIPEISVLMRAGGISTSGFSSNIIINKEVLRACKENGIYTNIAMILSKYPRKILELFL